LTTMTGLKDAMMTDKASIKNQSISLHRSIGRPRTAFDSALLGITAAVGIAAILHFGPVALSYKEECTKGRSSLPSQEESIPQPVESPRQACVLALRPSPEIQEALSAPNGCEDGLSEEEMRCLYALAERASQTVTGAKECRP
jgi:hypothetical protein